MPPFSPGITTVVEVGSDLVRVPVNPEAPTLRVLNDGPSLIGLLIGTEPVEGLPRQLYPVAAGSDALIAKGVGSDVVLLLGDLALAGRPSRVFLTTGTGG